MDRDKHGMIILITGYLGTPTTKDTLLIDHDQRIDGTILTIQSVLNFFPGQMIFVALTGDPLQARILEERIMNKSVSFKFFDQNTEDVTRGKGYFEYALLLKALNHWEPIFGSLTIVKITAKYRVLNLNKVANYADSLAQPLVVWKNLGREWVDTRCFAFKARTIVENNAILSQIDEQKKIYFESSILALSQSMQLRMPMFIHRPIISGLSGTTGLNVETSKLKIIVCSVSSFFYDSLRRLIDCVQNLRKT